MTECCFPGCHNDIGQWGHNTAPLMKGRCCDSCNFRRVIPARLDAAVAAYNNKEEEE